MPWPRSFYVIINIDWIVSYRSISMALNLVSSQFHAITNLRILDVSYLFLLFKWE